jgi:hypothetical protein
MPEQEFRSQISLDLGESTICRLLAGEFPSLHWEEGDSSWDKFRVWGISSEGEIALIRVYRYESPGPFDLTVRLRLPDGSNAVAAHNAIRGRVLKVLDATL